MTNRPLKFRFWDAGSENLTYSSEYERLDHFFERYYLFGENGKIDQFSGLTDKNGREIYESDIFKGGHYKWEPVEFMGGCFVASLKGGRLYDLEELVFDDNGKPEIVGNIYENPELLA